MLDPRFPAPTWAAPLDLDHDQALGPVELQELDGDQLAKLVQETVLCAPGSQATPGSTVSAPTAARALARSGDATLARLLAAPALQRADEADPRLRGVLTRALVRELGPPHYARIVAQARAEQGLSETGARAWLAELPPRERRLVEQRLPELRLAPLPQNSRLALTAAATRLVHENTVTMIGEDHWVDEEDGFTEWMKKAPAMGVGFLAVELPHDQQPALDHLLKTGDTSRFSRPVETALQSNPSWIALMRAAYNDGKGVKVVAVDAHDDGQPLPELGPEVSPAERELRLQAYAQRERDIATRLGQLATGGKVLAWYGWNHVVRDSSPHANARTLLEADGVKVGSLKLETANYRAERLDELGSDQAHASHFRDAAPKKSFAVRGEQLRHLSFQDQLPPVPQPGEIAYATGTDYVGLLDEKDGMRAAVKFPPGSNPRLQQLFDEALKEVQDRMPRDGAPDTLTPPR